MNADTIATMRPGVMVVNTGRGALIDTAAAVDGLKSHQIGSLALDVYEEEGDLFFEDRSGEVLDDDVFARLLTFPNVLITAHQAFLTHEALDAIATTTLANVAAVLGRRAVREQPDRLNPGAGRPLPPYTGPLHTVPRNDLGADWFRHQNCWAGLRPELLRLAKRGNPKNCR